VLLILLVQFDLCLRFEKTKVMQQNKNKNKCYEKQNVPIRILAVAVDSSRTTRAAAK
jgi:hypothetical protein